MKLEGERETTKNRGPSNRTAAIITRLIQFRVLTYAGENATGWRGTATRLVILGVFFSGSVLNAPW